MGHWQWECKHFLGDPSSDENTIPRYIESRRVSEPWLWWLARDGAGRDLNRRKQASRVM